MSTRNSLALYKHDGFRIELYHDYADGLNHLVMAKLGTDISIVIPETMVSDIQNVLKRGK